MPHHNRIDSFQMTRVGRQNDLNRLAGGRVEGAALSQVVLHVAAAFGGERQRDALELAEHLFVGLAEDIDEHVESSAVRHPDNDLLDTVLGGAVDELRQCRNQDVGALQGEALVPT